MFHRLTLLFCILFTQNILAKDNTIEYIGDVVAGAAIGSLSSWFFTDRYEAVKVQPMVNNGSYGVTVAYTW